MSAGGGRASGEPSVLSGATLVRGEEAGPGVAPKVAAMAAGGCARSGLRLPALLLLLLLLQILLQPRTGGAAGPAAARWSGPGTVPHLQSIFLGRCAEFVALLRPELR